MAGAAAAPGATLAARLARLGPNVIVRLVNGNAGELTCVSWHPRATAVFATACSTREVFIFHAAHRHSIGLPIVAVAPVESVAFSRPDGAHIAVGCRDGTLQERSRLVWAWLAGLQQHPLGPTRACRARAC